MKLICRCLPGYETILPKPVAARAALPGWLRAMPDRAASTLLGGAELRTLKHCPPMIDAAQAGIIFPLACDLDVRGGRLEWDWNLPRHKHARPSRAPVGFHAPEQATGAPFARPGQLIVKFTNFWTVETEPGWSLFITHPVHREDLPFRTLSGLVDCDRFRDGFVHFPALWLEPGFEGRLPAGTPVAQAVPIRRETLDLVIEPMDEERLRAHMAVQDGLQAEPGLYRRDFRRGGAMVPGGAKTTPT